MKTSIYGIFFIFCCLCVTGGCKSKSAESNAALSGEAVLLEKETEIISEGQVLLEVNTENDNGLSMDETEGKEETEDLVEISEIPEEENGLLELYADGKAISIPPNTIMASVSLEELLNGNLALYDRFRIDGWVFEWLMSDYDCANYYKFLSKGVLVISREENAEDVQIMHLEGLGGIVKISLEHKFEYLDVNFDGVPELLLCAGHHGNQGLIRYKCLLQTEEGFVEEETFEGIANPSIDAENKVILSQWRNNAISHSWAEYVYQDGSFVLTRELTEDLADDMELNPDKYIWVWTVNGEEIARSDELTEEEIDNLIYNENSDWGISCDRWRTLYNQGITTDFSIYGEP